MQATRFGGGGLSPALPRWAVVGDALNEAKVAHQVAARLRAKGKEVHVVARGGSPLSGRRPLRPLRNG